MSVRKTPMGPPRFVIVVAATCLTAAFVAGCVDPGALLSTIQTFEVQIVNDTSFAVDPNIRYDDDASFLAGWFPAGSLDTGLVTPGDAVSYTFDCDQLGLIFSDEAEQVVPLFGDYVLDATDIIDRDHDYGCGDTIQFRFVGDALDFGVVVSVNGRVVD